MTKPSNPKVVSLVHSKAPPPNLNLANFLSLLRLLLAPAIVWALLTQHYRLSLGLFFLAGISDALDGIAARLMHTRTKIGEYLDPLADKVLLTCVYLTLGIQDFIPLWLMLLVLFRDFLIVTAILLTSLLHSKSLKMDPIFISKLNTVLQLFLILMVLVDLSAIFGIDFTAYTNALSYTIATTTILSGASYGYIWIKHVNS